MLSEMNQAMAHKPVLKEKYVTKRLPEMLDSDWSVATKCVTVQKMQCKDLAKDFSF